MNVYRLTATQEDGLYYKDVLSKLFSSLDGAKKFAESHAAKYEFVSSEKSEWEFSEVTHGWVWMAFCCYTIKEEEVSSR